MRAAIMRSGPGIAAPRRFGHAEVFAAVFGLSFLVARVLPLLELGYVCPFRALTGIPCATCGMTHAFVHLAHGEVAAALAASPLGAAVAALAWSFALLDAMRIAAALPLPRVSATAARLAARVGVVALLANWLWIAVASRG